MDAIKEREIVIVGAGICGLATALALHRKGIKSVVLERSESLRAAGAGITIRTNGWRALDQLGVGSKLRLTALPLQGAQDIWLANGKKQHIPLGIGETRCIKRSDLITALAESLPLGTIHLGYQVLSVTLDPLTSYPILQLHNGSTINPKVLIGCDGANSVVADFLQLKPTKFSSLSEVRGFTEYTSGHDFPIEFFQVWGDHKHIIGRIPLHHKLVYWFVNLKGHYKGSMVAKDPELIQQLALESIKGFPTEMIDMVKNSLPESLFLSRLRYRAPWDVLLGSFRKGTVTVAGDAMHVMGPFLGQGGSAGIEDAIVLARCLAQKMDEIDIKTNGRQGIVQKIEEALDKYVKERRMRLVYLSTQTYLYGLQIEFPSVIMKFVCTILLMAIIRDLSSHTQYDCGSL